MKSILIKWVNKSRGEAAAGRRGRPAALLGHRAGLTAAPGRPTRPRKRPLLLVATTGRAAVVRVCREHTQ